MYGLWHPDLPSLACRFVYDVANVKVFEDERILGQDGPAAVVVTSIDVAAASDPE